MRAHAFISTFPPSFHPIQGPILSSNIYNCKTSIRVSSSLCSLQIQATCYKDENKKPFLMFIPVSGRSSSFRVQSMCLIIFIFIIGIFKCLGRVSPQLYLVSRAFRLLYVNTKYKEMIKTSLKLLLKKISKRKLNTYIAIHTHILFYHFFIIIKKIFR